MDRGWGYWVAEGGPWLLRGVLEQELVPAFGEVLSLVREAGSIGPGGVAPPVCSFLWGSWLVSNIVIGLHLVASLSKLYLNGNFSAVFGWITIYMGMVDGGGLVSTSLVTPLSLKWEHNGIELAKKSS